jgi:hypothetical protein
MCLPKIADTHSAPATPPAPPGEAPRAPIFGAEGSDSAATRAARRGRSALRIDLASGGLSGGTGLNIPN